MDSNYLTMKVHYREAQLLNAIRTKYRFGNIELLTADGLPKQITKTIERDIFDDKEVIHKLLDESQKKEV